MFFYTGFNENTHRDEFSQRWLAAVARLELVARTKEKEDRAKRVAKREERRKPRLVA